jgi:hypothetical protein
MRALATILLSATYFLASVDCYSQDPCSARAIIHRPGEQPPTVAEAAHHVMLTTTHERRRYLIPADVGLILKCGTPQEAEELFTDVRDTPTKLVGVTVVEADQHVIRVTWEDGFKPGLAPFHFYFDLPLTAIPNPGDKIDIIGTYSSYTRDPFRITMKNSSFGFNSAKVIVPN